METDMILKRTLPILAALAAVSWGQSSEPRRRGFDMSPELRRENTVDMISAFLGLTDAQKEQAKKIFEDARKSAESLEARIDEGRLALLRASTKTEGQSRVEELAGKQGQLLGQMAAIEAGMFAKFIALLKPEQQQRAEQLYLRMPGMGGLFLNRQGMGNPVMKAMGHGMGGLTPGDAAPDFGLKVLHSEDAVRLSSFKDKKPVALVFGSYT